MNSTIQELQQRYANLTRTYNQGIIVNPLQTGGRLTDAAKAAMQQFGDGYSVCDHCKGRLEGISNPPIDTFVEKDLPQFIGADAVKLTHGAREGKYLVFHAITKPGDVVVVDRNRHYSSDAAIQRAGLNVVKVDNDGTLERKMNVEDYIPLIKQHRPKLLFITYPDGSVGNLPDVKRLGDIAQEYEIPLVVNAAYAIGRMPISLQDIGANFVIGSGHKSMASMGPVGVLGMKEKWRDILTRPVEGHKGKEIECLGCTVRGTPLITLMASFPEVVERTGRWDEEVAKARWFSGELESLGLEQMGEKPHAHDLMMFQTDVFYQISGKHPQKRAFLYEALKENGIFGVKHGLTKSMKISTYGTSREDLEKVVATFKDLVNRYG